MSWPEFITHVTATTSKVDKILVYDEDGNLEAATGGVETTQSEGQALANCIHDPTLLLTKLHVDGDCFWCIQGVDSNLVGRGVKDESKVICAKQDGGNSVVFIGRSAGKGSFIFELQDSLALRAQGRLLPQIQRQQHDNEPQQMLVTADVNPIDTPLATDQMLVDIP